MRPMVATLTRSWPAATPHPGFVDHRSLRYYGSGSIKRWSDADFIGKSVTVKVVHFYAADDGEVVVIAAVESVQFSGPKTFIFRMDDNKIAHMRITA